MGKNRQSRRTKSFCWTIILVNKKAHAVWAFLMRRSKIQVTNPVYNLEALIFYRMLAMAVILQVDFPTQGPLGAEMSAAFQSLVQSINQESGMLWKI